MLMSLIPRPFLTVLVLGLPILLVIFGVVMGFQLLLAALGDAWGASAALFVAITCLILVVVDLILLIICLGIAALERPVERSDDHPDIHPE